MASSFSVALNLSKLDSLPRFERQKAFVDQFSNKKSDDITKKHKTKPFKLVIIVFIIMFVVYLLVPSGSTQKLKQEQQNTFAGEKEVHKPDLEAIAYRDVYPLPDPDSRSSDMIDTFARFAHRTSCPISSLDLHRPFEPLCRSREEVLEAMSGGGRIGIDAPYMPRGCDMRWYDRGDICNIMSKYDKILFVGDSFMRHVVAALHILLREDLGFGAVTDWNFRQDERDTCFCQGQFDTLKCGLQGIFNSADVAKFDLESLKCDARSFDVRNYVIPVFPPDEVDLRLLADSLKRHTSDKPVAIVYGQGHHNNLDPVVTGKWLDTIMETVSENLPTYAGQAHLFVTPSAAGPDMYDVDVLKHGHKPIVLFESGMMPVTKARGIDILGTVNMTLQTTLTDGKHADIKTNLLKAMMVLNWLDQPSSENVAPPVKEAIKSPEESLSAAEIAAKVAQRQLLSKPPELPAHAAAILAKDQQKADRKIEIEVEIEKLDKEIDQKQFDKIKKINKGNKKSLSKVIPQEDEEMAANPGRDTAPQAATLPRREKHAIKASAIPATATA
ncbi:hypothetical protein V1512DRAFT_264618 [Lipomyces arxii]|uniref:uncharacterized protein n=1 Tax=Lipomyces arxii TaxID=56418 RepID=UPI0034CD104F